MKHTKIIALIMCAVMCLSVISVPAAVFAADEKLIDTASSSSIKKAGFESDSKNTNKTKYSARWKIDDTKTKKVENAPKDFSGHNTLNFSMKVESSQKATIMVYFGSENPSTDGIDYYSYVIKDIEPGVWKDYSIKYSDLKANRTPLGWNQITELSLRAEGWNNTAAEGSVVYIESMYLSGEKIDVQSSAPTTNQNGENEANVGKLFYYNNFDDKDKGINAGANVLAKTNSITHEFDEKGNGYVKLETLADTDDHYIEASLQSTQVNNLVVEIVLSTENEAPTGNLQYKDIPDKKQGTLFKINAGNEISINNKTTKLKKGAWTKLGFIIDFSKNSCDAYAAEGKNGKYKKIATYSPGTTSNNLSIMRMYINKNTENIGKTLLVDDFAVYGGSEFRDVSGEEVVSSSSSSNANKIAATEGADVEMEFPSLSELNGGVALMLGESDAYANGQLTKVDKDNENVVPLTVDDRTLVPVRFISESFGADVGWNGETSTATVSLGGKTIEITLGSKIMRVDGGDVEIDVAAADMNDRTMLPLRALVEALGKNVLWDDRGLIVITNSDTVLDAAKDVKLSTMLIGLIKNGVEKNNYAAAPVFTQSIIDEACAAPFGAWTAASGNSTPGEKSANIIYYLTLAARTNPDYAATDGTLCKDAALDQLRFLLEGGHEPFACVGCYWGHAVVASALLLVKNTPVVYDELTDDEKDRMDWLMRGLAIAGNWGYNDKNDYSTGFDLLGNFGKTWNPNFRNTYLSIVMSAGMYFGLDELDEIFTSFDYDTYIKKYTELGFTNILATWTVAGKGLMENGGSCTLLGAIGLSHMEAGQSGGSGAGVKLPFLYGGKRAEPGYIFKNLAKFTYSWNVINDFGTKGEYDYTYILSGKTSPFEGQMGMMKELAGGDGGAGDGGSTIRSRTTYGYDSYEILCSVYANMKLLGYWDSSDKKMREIDNRIYVGNEDLIFKMSEGYHGFSSGKGSDEFEYSFLSRGHKFVKDIWRNFHCMQNEKVTTAPDPNAEIVAQIPAAEPKDGITGVPAGAFESVMLGASGFTGESYYSIGESLKKGSMEFDIVIGPKITDETYDSVVMIAKKEDGIDWAKSNMGLQFKDRTIKIRNGGQYIKTGIAFTANYRYHVKASFDVDTRKYSVRIEQIYPAADKEVSFTAENYDFRTGGSPIDCVDSLCIVKSAYDSVMWIENFELTK